MYIAGIEVVIAGTSAGSITLNVSTAVGFGAVKQHTLVTIYNSYYGSAMAQWVCVELRSKRSGIRSLSPPCCVLEQDTLLPESTGNTQEAVAPSRPN